MDNLFKVAHKVPPTDITFNVKWRDGQLADMRDNGYYDLTNKTRMYGCVIRTTDDYWTLRGSTDWKSTLPAVMEFKKRLCVANVYLRGFAKQGFSGGFRFPKGGFSNSFSDGLTKRVGKYRWEAGYEEPPRLRMREWFVDYKWLLDSGHINQAQFDSIYDRTIKHLPIILSVTLDTILKHEDEFSKLASINSDLVEVW